MPDTTGIVRGGLDPRPLPAAGWVRFRAVDYVGLGFVAELDERIPMPSDGYGTHNVLDRGPREGVATFAGRAPLRMPVALLFDLEAQGKSIEPAIRVLEQLHGLDDTLPAPPRMIVEGVGVPWSYSRAAHLRWVFDGAPEWGDDVRAAADGSGDRSYLSATVTLLRAGALTTAATSVAAAAAAARPTFTVSKNANPRTLRSIGKKYGKTWQQMLELNPTLTRDVDRPLKNGTKVRYA
ncbi:MAG: hypothetical protein PGN13_16055 [Patulibacter minatonensis]